MRIRNRLGFSLFELAIALLLAGLVAGLALQFSTEANRQDNYTDTKAKLERVREAVNRYAVSNNRFPMPARRDIGVDDAKYGKEAALADLTVVNNADGTVAVYGALPFFTLGLTRDEAIDSWGNKITYIVTQALTETANFNNATNGAVDVNSKVGVKFLEGAGFVVISHGADEYGAVKENYKGTDKKWCLYDAAKAGKTANCSPVKASVSRAFAISTTHHDGKDATGTFFDDVVTFKGKPWILVPVNGVCNTSGTVDGTGPVAAGYRCTSGTYADYVAGASCGANTWKCRGAYGGADANCSAPAYCPPPPCDGTRCPGGKVMGGASGPHAISETGVYEPCTHPYYPISVPCVCSTPEIYATTACPPSSPNPGATYCRRSHSRTISLNYAGPTTTLSSADGAYSVTLPSTTIDSGWLPTTDSYNPYTDCQP